MNANNDFNKFWNPATLTPPEFNIIENGSEWFETDSGDNFLNWSSGTFAQTFFVNNSSYSIIARARDQAGNFSAVYATGAFIADRGLPEILHQHSLIHP